MTEKDIYSNGVALLEEWEDVNYCEHSFKFKDEWLTDKEVVDLLNELDEKYVDEFSLRETLQQELQRSEEENEQLKLELDTHKHPLWSTREAEKIVNELKQENEQLKSENKRLTDKLNKTALELVDGVISQGKATEISEMSYREFLEYRAKNGKPMELKK